MARSVKIKKLRFVINGKNVKIFQNTDIFLILGNYIYRYFNF